MKTILLSSALIMIGVIGGCTKDNHTSMMTGGTTPSLALTPSDGATNVRFDASVTLSFAKPVDQPTTERNLHLFSQKDMNDSDCPMGMMMGQGMMDAAMVDSNMMNHLIGQHNTRGHFQWNGNGTACDFRPDSMMMPKMTYMIHMGREMVQMMQTRMGEMNMMGGHGSGMMSGEMMYHFTTMDTTGTGGSHDGHH